MARRGTRLAQSVSTLAAKTTIAWGLMRISSMVSALGMLFTPREHWRCGMRQRPRLTLAISALLLIALLALDAIPTSASAQSPAPVPPGLVSWWPGDGDADDIAGSNPGTPQSGATFATGKVDQAFSLDGANDHVAVGNPSVLQLSTGTLEAWIKTTNSGGGFRGIIVKQSAYALFLKNGVLVTYDWSVAQTRSTGLNLADGQFHHVAITFQNGVSGGTIIYADAVSVLTTTMAVSDQSQGLVIGAGNLPSSDQFFDGLIDEVSIYDRVLSDTEIQGIFDAGSAGKAESAGPAEAASSSGSGRSRGGGRSLPDPQTWLLVISGLALLGVCGGFSLWRRRESTRPGKELSAEGLPAIVQN